MGTPKLNLDELHPDDFEGGADDPELFDLLDTTPENVGENEARPEPPADNSDLFDAPPATAEAPSATPQPTAGSREEELTRRITELENRIASQQAPASEPSIWERAANSEFMQRMGRGAEVAGQKTSDFFRGVGRGVTADWADEAAAALVPDVDDGTGIPRTYAEGSADDAMLAHMRKEQAEAEARNPGITTAGKLTGAVAQGVLTAPALPAAVGLRGAMAANAAQGLVLGAAQASGAAEQDKAKAAIEGGAWGGLIGGAVPAVAQGVSKAVRPATSWIADKAKSVADWARGGATGAYGGQYKTLAEEEGLDFVDEQLGQEVERLFPHKGVSGYFTGDPAKKSFWSARDYATAAEKARGELGAARGEAIKQADEQLPEVVPTAEVIGAIRSSKSPFMKGAAKPDQTIASTIDDIADTAASRYTDEYMTPSQLNELKHSLERAGYGGQRGQDRIIATPESMSAIAHRAAADPVRARLNDSIAELALPETADQFAQANADFPIAKIVENMSRERAAKEAGNQLLNLPTVGYAAAGGGAGMWSGYDKEKGLIESAPEMLKQGITGAATGAVGGHLMRTYGKEALANTARGVQHALEPSVADDVAKAVAEESPSGVPFADELASPPVAASEDTGPLRAALNRRLSQSAARVGSGTAAGYGGGAAARPPYGVTAAADDGEEYSPLPATDDMHEQALEQQAPPSGWRDTVKYALDRTDVAQTLGPYAEEFSQALIAKDTQAVDRLIAKHQGDTYFRTQVFPELQRIAAEGGR